MKTGISARTANIGLGIGVTLALAVAIGFAIPLPSHGTRVAAATEGGTATGIVRIKLAARPTPAPIQREAARAASVARAIPVRQTSVPKPPVAVAETTVADLGVEPFEPPPPPIADAARGPRLTAGEQLAALPPSETAASPPAPEVVALAAPEPPPPEPLPPAPPRPAAHAAKPVQAPPALPIAPLPTVAIGDRGAHRVPDRNAPIRSVTVVSREPDMSEAEPPAPTEKVGRARDRIRNRDASASWAPSGATAGKTESGRPFAGTAIVTGALELNVAGKPLRLAGIKLPVATDMCAIASAYAARSCADVTRQALIARVGTGGAVSCRILGAGQVWPAVCKDSTGRDLAGYLIERGFALADDNELVNYSPAETQAKNARHGLWSYR